MSSISQSLSPDIRLVFLDTETTGLKPSENHRIVEIGAVEVINRIPTGRTFQRYLNPERSSDPRAFEIHQLDEHFLAKQPKFSEVVEDLLAFIDDATLAIHNADFDLGFINAELKRIRKPALTNAYIDTIKLARGIVSGLRSYSLDALCDHFQIDRRHRTIHGALLDTELLVEMYLQMTRQQGGLDLESFDSLRFLDYLPEGKNLQSIKLIPLLVSDITQKNHQEMLCTFEKVNLKQHFWNN